MDEVTSNGWRYSNEEACREKYIVKTEEEIVIYYCDRPKGHKGWHCNDSKSWEK